jgi:AraC-like DNA-binding protein
LDPRKSQRNSTSPGLSRLRRVCRRLKFEPHDIAAQLDSRGRYEVELDREFPLLVKLFHYTSRRHTRGATWHERLELFTPLDGPARFSMGKAVVQLAPGDVLVVDNLKLHHVVDFPGFNTRVIVISFFPDFVFSLGSPSHDYAFLLPFYSRLEKVPHVMRRSAPDATGAHQAMARLLECYFDSTRQQLRQAGCKVFLLELLYHLARHFQSSEVMKWEFLRQQERSMLLKPLFDHISRHYPERISVPDAARLVHMSQPQFMKIFKRVSGTTLVAYLNHVRLSNGARMLKETSLSIAEIASASGFADQSYFDRRFKAAFGQTPRQFRDCAGKLPPATPALSTLTSPEVS